LLKYKLDNVQGDQEGLFVLVIQLRTFYIRLFATLQPALLIYLTDY
jgi:hypothetical protein